MVPPRTSSTAVDCAHLSASDYAAVLGALAAAAVAALSNLDDEEEQRRRSLREQSHNDKNDHDDHDDHDDHLVYDSHCRVDLSEFIMVTESLSPFKDT